MSLAGCEIAVETGWGRGFESRRPLHVVRSRSVRHRRDSVAGRSGLVGTDEMTSVIIRGPDGMVYQARIPARTSVRAETQAGHGASGVSTAI